MSQNQFNRQADLVVAFLAGVFFALTISMLLTEATR